VVVVGSEVLLGVVPEVVVVVPKVVVVALETVVFVDEGVDIDVVGVAIVWRVVDVSPPLAWSWGAATLRGDDGRSLTRLSAALTICQVSKVVSATTTNHPPISVVLLTS
jgi:hypothetical protein